MKQNFLPSKTFTDKKQKMFLNITPHFIQAGRFMARDFMFAFSRTKNNFGFASPRPANTRSDCDAVGRFLNPEKIIIEKGEMTDKEMKYLKRIAKVVCKK